jgi:plasma kallikrein
MKESQRFEVEKIVIHPKFLIIIYDFSLLFLKNEVPLNKFTGLICLPPPKFNFDNLKRCYVSGFGIKNSNETVIGSTELRSAKLPIVPFQKCNDALKDHPRSSPGFLLHDSFICAGGEEGVDACKVKS